MEEAPNGVSVSHDASHADEILSDLTATPPPKSKDLQSRRKHIIDAKLKRKWRMQIEKEKAHEKQQAKQQDSKATNNTASEVRMKLTVSI